MLQRLVRDATGTTPACDTGNDYDGRLSLRVAAIFVIWLGSSVGATFPVFANRNKGLKVPEWTFFAAKYFGSGVIVATAFIHLLGPAEDALRNPCLTGSITDYSWAEGIILMTIFVLFLVELLVTRYGNFGSDDQPGGAHAHEHQLNEMQETNSHINRSKPVPPTREMISATPSSDGGTHARGEADLVPATTYTMIRELNDPLSFEDYNAQMTALFILEFGIIFHSVFIGLTLAVAGQEFDTLFVVLVFHQTFEGLGLGARLASTPWPRAKRLTPYILGLAFGLSTPLAIAIGLGVRKSYPPGSQTTLIVNGVFDSISAGILIYTGLVELMAHEFMFSGEMRKAPIKVVLSAFGLMTIGAALMALLGKWA